MADQDAQIGQGSAGGTDITTQLRGITQQLSSSNMFMTSLIAAVSAVTTAINAETAALTGAFPRTLLGYTVATLPSSPSIGAMAYVTDGGAALAWGANVAGGGTAKYIVWWNGSGQWTVVGK